MRRTSSKREPGFTLFLLLISIFSPWGLLSDSAASTLTSALTPGLAVATFGNTFRGFHLLLSATSFSVFVVLSVAFPLISGGWADSAMSFPFFLCSAFSADVLLSDLPPVPFAPLQSPAPACVASSLSFCAAEMEGHSSGVELLIFWCGILTFVAVPRAFAPAPSAFTESPFCFDSTSFL